MICRMCRLGRPRLCPSRRARRGRTSGPWARRRMAETAADVTPALAASTALLWGWHARRGSWFERFGLGYASSVRSGTDDGLGAGEMREIEVKYRVCDLAALEHELAMRGAAFGLGLCECGHVPGPPTG
jgi:hypothetical protein